MLTWAWITAAVLCAGNGENLLANPGFEELVADRPVRWEVFVMPMPGAAGRLDDSAAEGKYAVMLHTPVPYAQEPVNNWSQNVIAELAGKRFELSGAIKAAEASEAALWAQCWRKQPWGVLHVANTSIDTPIYGTRDWQRVSVTFEVPKETDFITVRCVLKGTGTAWFDDVSLMAAPEQEPAQEAVEEKAAEGNGTPALKEANAEYDAALLTPLDPARRPAEAVTVLEAEVGRLREANLLLAETVQAMQHANVELLEKLGRLRKEVSSLEQRVAGQAPSPGAPERDTRVAPPLVPHGEDWRNYR